MIQGLYPIFDHWHKEGTVYIYSDPHFNEDDLVEGIKGRPDAETQLKMINSKVGKKDTFICLGDVGDLEVAKRIKGYKVLIAGNHDTGLDKYREVFDEVYAGALFIGEKILLSHEPIEKFPYAINIHGHNHAGSWHPDMYHYNVCADVIGYTPVNFNQFMKTGPAAHIQSIHRNTIDKATKNKAKRKGKK